MLRFLLVVLLILIGLPAEAQQGRNDIQPLYRTIGHCFLRGLTNGGLFRPVETLGFLFMQLR
jgi:hypothetical protein